MNGCVNEKSRNKTIHNLTQLIYLNFPGNPCWVKSTQLSAHSANG